MVADSRSKPLPRRFPSRSADDDDVDDEKDASRVRFDRLASGLIRWSIVLSRPIY